MNIKKPIKKWTRKELQEYLENRGGAVYDDEPIQDLRDAVEEDLPVFAEDGEWMNLRGQALDVPDLDTHELAMDMAGLRR